MREGNPNIWEKGQRNSAKYFLWQRNSTKTLACFRERNETVVLNTIKNSQIPLSSLYLSLQFQIRISSLALADVPNLSGKKLHFRFYETTSKSTPSWSPYLNKWHLYFSNCRSLRFGSLLTFSFSGLSYPIHQPITMTISSTWIWSWLTTSIATILVQAWTMAITSAGVRVLGNVLEPKYHPS